MGTLFPGSPRGPLSYSPENPPDRNYYFQYGWVLPGIFAEGARRRRHYYLGAPRSADLGGLEWQQALPAGRNRKICV
jgi:hypothetical protein